ncbi:MAG: enoyl-CoA hydratase [Acidimicrobiaceae bacterium]|nr:enoyl-CoA hydratase [Acidimicrobiaceae bacterium]|tara:strand:- start:1977 stop:2792 length:816 start_codon:yes stop_codon:yes gene_type:complete
MDLRSTKYEVLGTTAVVFLSRPERHNAWTGRMHTEYRWLLEQAESDPSVKAVVVTGDPEGGTFCVGADAKALQGHAERGDYDDGVLGNVSRPGFGVDRAFDADFVYHFGLEKPVVAAINGATAGVGLVLACFADLRFAVPGAKLTAAHGKLGLPAEYGLSWQLPRLIGLSRANDILLTSRVVGTDEAHEMGLVNGLFDDALAGTLAWIEEFLGPVARSSLSATRRQVYLDLHRNAASSVADSLNRFDAHIGSDQYLEGVQALSEKRRPAFD